MLTSFKNLTPIKLQFSQAFTLIELVITIVLTSVILVVFVSLYSSVQTQSAFPVIQVKASQLAQAYLEEISLKRFDENSPVGNRLRCDQVSQPACSNTLGFEPGETRSDFDDVDDYNNLIDSPPIDTLGNIKTGFNNFSVSVLVSYAGNEQGFNTRDLKRIQLTIISPQKDRFIFSLYKGNF